MANTVGALVGVALFVFMEHRAKSIELRAEGEESEEERGKSEGGGRGGWSLSHWVILLRGHCLS